MRRAYYTLIIFLFTALVGSSALAQEAAKCAGDPVMCAQILDLQAKLAAQKELASSVKVQVSDDTKIARADAEVIKVQAVKAEDDKTSNKAARMMAFAASLAVALKILISILTSWKGYFTSDRAKAWLKLSLVGSGFMVFLATNLGFGIPWWQSMILAGGGPGSILVHELTKMIPVLKGTKKYEEVDPDGDPTNADPDGDKT